MPSHAEVLVAILNHPRDLAAARESTLVPNPCLRRPKMADRRWPAKMARLLPNQDFGTEAFAINYYAEVIDVRQATRSELFPDEPRKRNRRDNITNSCSARCRDSRARSRAAAGVESSSSKLPGTSSRMLRKSMILYDESPLGRPPLDRTQTHQT